MVMTTGYGDVANLPGIADDYTQFFSGTSSASAIIAGVSTVLQSLYQHSSGTRMTPAQLRSVESHQGAPSEAAYTQPLGIFPTVNHIGRQPDLRDLLELMTIGAPVSHVFSGGWKTSGNGNSVQLGDSISSLGDVDGDGVSDLLLPGGASEQVLVVSGRTGKTLRTDGLVTPCVATAVGDVDGDGKGDYAAAVPSATVSSPPSVYLVAGKDGSVISSYTWPSPVTMYYLDVVQIGDLTGDGRAEVLALSTHPYATPGAFVISTPAGSSGSQVIYPYPSTTNFVPLAACGLRDLNLDGRDDFAIATPDTINQLGK